jgi:hypothetical protein
MASLVNTERRSQAQRRAGGKEQLYWNVETMLPMLIKYSVWDTSLLPIAIFKTLRGYLCCISFSFDKATHTMSKNMTLDLLAFAGKGEESSRFVGRPIVSSLRFDNETAITI